MSASSPFYTMNCKKFTMMSDFKTRVVVFICSSISTWVKNCEKLALSEEKKEELDLFIDQLYEELEKGIYDMYIQKII